MVREALDLMAAISIPPPSVRIRSIRVYPYALPDVDAALAQPHSMTTQCVVGTVGESDRALLETVQRAHRELGLWRAYFSAFHPIARSPLADAPTEDPPRALSQVYVF